MNSPKVIIGGSFDPVHNAHIALAQKLSALLKSTVTLLPAHLSPLKSHSHSQAAQRLHMLQLAIQSTPNITIDTRELSAQGVSYTIDTLKQYRDEYKDSPVLFVMGMDSFNHFNQWKDWTEFLSLCHLVIADRADSTLDNAQMSAYLQSHQTDDVAQLLNKPSGHIWHYPFEAYKISSTQIRRAIAEKQTNLSSLEFNALDASVWQYIKQQQLYFKSPFNY